MCLRLMPLTPPPPSPQPPALDQSSSGQWDLASLQGCLLLGLPKGTAPTGAGGAFGWGLGVFCGR